MVFHSIIIQTVRMFYFISLCLLVIKAFILYFPTTTSCCYYLIKIILCNLYVCYIFKTGLLIFFLIPKCCICHIYFFISIFNFINKEFIASCKTLYLSYSF